MTPPSLREWMGTARHGQSLRGEAAELQTRRCSSEATPEDGKTSPRKAELRNLQPAGGTQRGSEGRRDVSLRRLPIGINRRDALTRARRIFLKRLQPLEKKTTQMIKRLLAMCQRVVLKWKFWPPLRVEPRDSALKVTKDCEQTV